MPLFPDKGYAYLMTSDGKIHKLNAIEVVAKPSFLPSLAADVTFKIPKLWNIPEYGGLNVHLLTKNSLCFLGTKLNKLYLHTEYKFADNFYKPVFTKSNDSVTMKFEWIPPNNMQLYFGVVTQFIEGYHYLKNAYLFSVSTAQTGYWKMPLTNWFEDGAPCLGLAPDGALIQEDRTYKTTLYELYRLVLDGFNNNIWNNHHLDRILIDYCHKIFTFDANGKNLPCQDWMLYSNKINNLYLDDIYSLFKD